MTATEIDRRKLLAVTGALAASALPATAFGAATADAIVDNAAGGYRFIPGIPAFSEGAVAMPGFAVVHVRFDRLVPLEDSYALVERELQSGDVRCRRCAGWSFASRGLIPFPNFAP